MPGSFCQRSESGREEGMDAVDMDPSIFDEDWKDYSQSCIESGE